MQITDVWGSGEQFQNLSACRMIDDEAIAELFYMPF
jgi:hypothetical protein